MLTQRPRGTTDILPAAAAEWRELERIIRELCDRYGYREIRTPIFEHTELFQRGIGDGTDVVEKEMYTFDDRGGRSITLRPENTAAVVRSFLENKIGAQAAITKLFYLGSMFRYDRPQKGRLREFHQFGVEALGEQSPLVDVEVIVLALRFLEALNLRDLELSVNSVGCATCRAAYREALHAFFADKRDQLCDDCRSRYDRAPMRILDCKQERCRELSLGAPAISDYLCDECRAHFERVKSLLGALGVPYRVDSRLVRGLDYYTKTAFEVKYRPLGAQNAVAGGGRYDRLVEEIGGEPTPAVGFAVGLERVILARSMQSLTATSEPRVDVFVVALGEAQQPAAFKLVTALRDGGLAAAMDYSGRSLKSQMKQADKAGARFVAIYGEAEAQAQSATLRDMAAATQSTVPLADIAARLAALTKEA